MLIGHFIFDFTQTTHQFRKYILQATCMVETTAELFQILTVDKNTNAAVLKIFGLLDKLKNITSTFIRLKLLFLTDYYFLLIVAKLIEKLQLCFLNSLLLKNF